MEIDDPGVVDPASLRARARRPALRCRTQLVAPALVLAGCVSYSAEPLDPPRVLHELVQRGREELRVQHSGPWQDSWFPLASEVRVADGVTLAEANTLALFYGSSVRAARADAGVAGAQVLQAGLLSNPELFVGPRISTEGSGTIFPASIGWDLPIRGEEGAERAAAEARWSERVLHVVEVELAALQQVRAGFVRIARLRREVEAWAAVVGAGREVIRWVEALARAGQADSVLIYLARTEQDEAEAAHVEAQTRAEAERRELFALLGLLPDAPVELAIEAAGPLPALPESDRRALLRVPALRAAEAAYATADAELRLEIRRQYPAIRFGPEFENDRGEPTVGLGLLLALPLFDRNQGNIAAAEQARSRARQSYESALLRTAHDEAAARASLASAERLLQLFREGAWRDAEAASRALDLRLRAGQSQVVEVLAAQRAIARARARLLELEEQAVVARLRAAVAGGLALQPDGVDAAEEQE